MMALLGRMFFWLSWPALYVYLRGTTRTRVMIEVDGHILLIKGWHDGAKWALPGGGVHKGEDARVSALREVREEVGIGLNDGQLVHLGSDHYHQRGLQYQIERYGCTLSERPEIRRQKHEVLAAAWYPISEIQPALVEPNVLRQLEAWQQIRYTS